MDVVKLQDAIRHKLNDFKSIERLANNEKFLRIWLVTPDTDQSQFLQFAKNGSRDACFDWFLIQSKRVLEAMPVHALRIMAKKQGISKFHHMDKATLLTELNKHASQAS
jgi:hypothetical protein